MVKKKDNTLDKTDKTEALTPNEDISRLLSKRTSNPDELIVSLSDAYENKRARQVVEWEKLGKQKIQPTI